jgi:AcrR family transcriptional regulator
VKVSFRQRLFDALEESIAQDGYPKTTIADIVRRARTSRRTFYEHFASKDECFVALLTEANATQIRQITGAVDPTAAWETQVRQAIEAWIASVDSRPALMLSWIRDVPALGLTARVLQREAMENFIAMVQALAQSEGFVAGGAGPVSRPRIVMLLGGLRELTAVTVEDRGRMSDITEDAVDAAIALVGPRN